MKYRKIGSAVVSAIGYGALPLSVEGRPSRDQALRTLDAALDAGITLIDTADSYCMGPDDTGHNERLIAAALRGRREQVLVATKGGHYRPGDGTWPVDGRPESLRRACEGSLRALGVPVIDLYQFHRPDPMVPFEDSVGAIAQLQDRGLVRMIGLSNVSIAQIESARTIVEIVSVQNRFSFGSEDSREVLEYCSDQGLAFLPWAPLGGLGRGGELGIRFPELSAVARDRGVSPQQIALAWLLQQSDVVVPIPGASRSQSVTDCAAATDLVLTAEESDRLSGSADASRTEAAP